MGRKQMNWVVVGTGALGNLWSLGLAASGASVQIFSRHSADSPEVLLQNSGRTTAEKRLAVISEPQDAAPGAVWLVMVKAWQLDEVLELLESNFSGQLLQLVISHNGMGAGEPVLSRQSQWQVYDLVTTHGAWRRNRFHSVHAGIGQSWIGPRKGSGGEADRAKPLWLPEFENARPPLNWDTAIESRRWQKLAINCAINPLAALAGVANGELSKPGYSQTIAAICDEIARVEKRLDPDELMGQVYNVIEATAGNQCSMLQDLKAGQVTEIDYLNGFVCEQGKRLNVKTPMNCELTDKIKQKVKHIAGHQP